MSATQKRRGKSCIETESNTSRATQLRLHKDLLLQDAEVDPERQRAQVDMDMEIARVGE